jgi:Spy/CpxP family protein refolding chaperone
MTPRFHASGAAPLLMMGLLALSSSRAVADDQAQAQTQAQPSPKPATGERARDRREAPDNTVGHVPELRDETFRLMDAYLISNLQESLGLTDEQFARAMPLVKKLQSDRRDFARRRMQALRALRRTLVSGSATEASVADLLKDVKNASTEERAATVRNTEALDAVLTPLQQAKFRVFEAEVDIRLRHLLARSQDKDKPSVR